MNVPSTETSKGRLLVVDDDASTRTALRSLLTEAGYTVDDVEDGSEALARVDAMPPDVIVTDLAMPVLDGFGLLAALRDQKKKIPTIVLTSATNVASAVEAMRAGADNFLQKPIDVGALVVAVERALEHRNVQEEVRNLRRHVGEGAAVEFAGLVGTSAPMQKIYRDAKRVAASRATVLITGESGTGKGEVARAIHALSPRSNAPFVSLHCAALAESILESELFGHEKGSFTGADRKRIGRFEQANGGTLFLDEVGDIPASTQVKLLRVLQERTLERVGGNEEIGVDVRVIAATNRDLGKAVRDGSFREDLFYRLNVVHLEMPPLRLRGGDVILLAQHFLTKYASENHKSVLGFTDAARTRILGARWLGNVRALENAIERAVIMCEGDTIDALDIPNEVDPIQAGGLTIPGATMQELERFAILKTLEAVNGSTSRAAEILNIGIRTIQYRLHEYGVPRFRPKGASHDAATPDSSRSDTPV